MLVIKTSGARGRGVFLTEAVSEGTLIERCPVIVVPAEQLEALAATSLAEYWFRWGPLGEDGAIALGFGSLYNHAPEPNAVYVRHFAEGVLEFIALRDIAADEEVLVNYHGGLADRSPVWFDIE